MKAVDLIPRDARSAERRKISFNRTGGIGAYAVLAVLAVAAVMSAATALSNKQLSDKRAELARVQAEARTADARARSLEPFTKFAALRAARVETVGGLLDGRFDWARSLREIARVVPANVDLTSIVGTVSPTTRVDAGGGGTTLRTTLPVPAIDLIGCAKSQAHVAKLLARLRAIDGVERVTLGQSEKSDQTAPNDADCRSTEDMPQFQLTVFYAGQEGIVPAADATDPAAGATSPAGSTTATSGGAK